METLRKTHLGAETRVLNAMYKKYGRVTQAMQNELTKRGYELCELGTSSRCYTASGMVGKKNFANDNGTYFGIGIYNISKKCRSNGYSVNVYRAWVKEVKA